LGRRDGPPPQPCSAHAKPTQRHRTRWHTLNHASAAALSAALVPSSRYSWIELNQPADDGPRRPCRRASSTARTAIAHAAALAACSTARRAFKPRGHRQPAGRWRRVEYVSRRGTGPGNRRRDEAARTGTPAAARSAGARGLSRGRFSPTMGSSPPLEGSDKNVNDRYFLAHHASNPT